MLAVLLQIDAWDPVAAAPVVLQAASHDEPALCMLAGATWWPAIAKLPTLRYDLFDGDFGGQISAPSSSLSLQAEPWADFGRYMLADARLRLWTGELGADWSTFTLRFDGRVSSQPALADGQASIDFAVDDRWLDAALLATYAGTTGAEGPAALKGQAKPLAIGAPRYVAGTLVDSVNSAFQVSGYGPIAGVDVALDKLVRFGAPIGDYPSYAALIAADIPAGRWATANAIGWARLGAPPLGQISFLVRGDTTGGWARKPGQIITRLATIAGAADRVDAASLGALDAARPYNLSLVLSDQGTARDLVQKIAASVNAVAGVSWTGRLFAVPVTLGVPTITLAADGSALPPVASVKQIENAAPWQKLAIGAARAWTVHQLADIAFEATLIDLGAYDAATTYREGNIVSLADGSRWLFIGTTPAVGDLPDPAGGNWALLSGPTAVIPPGTIIGGDYDPTTGTITGGQSAGDLVTVSQATAFAHLSNLADSELARIRDRALQFPGPDGASVTTLLKREATTRQDADSAFSETFDLLGAVNQIGSAFVFGDNAVIAQPDSAGATSYVSVSAKFAEHSGQIEHIDQVFTDADGTVSRALLRIGADGRMLGYSATNDGHLGAFVFTADTFTIETPDGDALFYADENGVKMHSVEVDTIKAKSIDNEQLADAAVQQCVFKTLSADISVPYSSATYA